MTGTVAARSVARGLGLVISLSTLLASTESLGLPAPADPCPTRVQVDCAKDVPSDICEFLTKTTPQAFAWKPKSGESFCALLPLPEVTFLYSKAGLTIRIPFTREVAEIFGFAETSYRRVKSKYVAFNTQDPDGTRALTAAGRDDFDVARQNSPFHLMFNTLHARVMTLTGDLLYQASLTNKGLLDKAPGVTRPGSVRLAFDAGTASLTSVGLDRDADARGFESVTSGGKTIKRDRPDFPAIFEKTKRSVLQAQ